MPENMSISVNGQSQVPPGFRFHPTEEELLQYYLRKKVSFEKIDLDVIRDVDLNKLEPWDIQEKCKIGSTPQNDWYFFSHKDKKYPTGTRTNRATAAGFWKATGRDKVIYSNSRRIGMRKTLVFYKGRAPHGQKSDWIMHEYRLDDNMSSPDTNNIIVSQVSDAAGEATQEEGWVVCRIFKKKNHHKSLDSPMISGANGENRTQITGSASDEGTLEQILHYMGGRHCKKEGEATSGGFLMPINERFMKLPSLESPSSVSSQPCNYQQPIQLHQILSPDQEANNNGDPNSVYQPEMCLSDWAALDRLVASQLNGQSETSKQISCFNDSPIPFSSPTPTPTYHPQLQHQLRSTSSSLSNRPFHPAHDDNGEFDLWGFSRPSMSSPDSLCHLPNTRV
ncbi:hypothetical protein NMG60_11022656 [Bertholletia excelsa]